MRRWREVSLFLVVLASCAAVLVAGEGGYRLAKSGSLRLRPLQFIKDTALVYRLNPERENYRFGFRGDGPPADRAGGVLVVCLGGSTTYGHSLTTDSVWPHLTQDALRATGVQAWVLNAGVPGYGSRQLLRRFQMELAALDPDYLVVFEAWNRAGALVDSTAFSPWGKDIVTRAFTVISPYSLLVRDAYAPFARREVWVGEWTPDPFQQVWIADVDSLVGQIVARGIRPLVVVYPALFHEGMTDAELQVYAGMGWQKRRYNSGMLDEIRVKHEALRRIAATHGAIVIDVAAAIDTIRGPARKALFFDDMHLSVPGNRVVARMVTKALVADLAARSHAGPGHPANH